MSNRNTPKYMQPCGAAGCPNLIGKKGGKGYCPRHYARLKRYGDATIILASDYYGTWSKCSVKECLAPVRSRFAELCMKHYHRKYRHGDVEANFDSISVRDQSEYQRTYAPDHPVAGPSGKTYVHRIVLYDAIGEGPHKCFWCKRIVMWRRGIDSPDALHADHLNGVRDDNRVDNLVPSCQDCNVARSSKRRHRILREKYGAWSVNDTIARLKTGRVERHFEEVES